MTIFEAEPAHPLLNPVGGAAVIAVLIVGIITVSAVTISTPRPAVMVQPVAEPAGFDARFPATPLKTVRTIPIVVPHDTLTAIDRAPPPPAAAQPAPPAPLPRPVPSAPDDTHRSASAAVDICVRHNLKKVFTNNGKSWRCSRPSL